MKLKDCHNIDDFRKLAKKKITARYMTEKTSSAKALKNLAL